MSEKKADRPRYWVTFLLEDLGVGETFNPDVLHWTIVPWFVTELDDQEVIKSFQQFLSGQKALDVTIGEEGEFKHRRKISVNFIKSSPEIDNLHNKTLEWLKILEARWAVKKAHVGPDYIPHIRRREGMNNIEAGQLLHFDSLALVRAHRRGDELRTVAAMAELK